MSNREQIYCRHWKDTPKVNRYGFGDEFLDAHVCKECYNHYSYGVISGLTGDIQMARWRNFYRQAQWLLAEKDLVIEELREAIEILEAEDLDIGCA